MSYARRGVLQLFTDVLFSDAIIKSVIIETCLTSMIFMQTLHSMNSPPPIENFITSPSKLSSSAVLAQLGASTSTPFVSLLGRKFGTRWLSSKIFRFVCSSRLTFSGLTTHNSMSASPALSALTSSNAECATKSAHLLSICSRFQMSPMSVKTSTSSPAPPSESRYVCLLQFLATRISSRNPYLYLSPTLAVQRFH